MEKLSPYTVLMWLAVLLVLLGAFLQLTHQISLDALMLFLATSFLLFLLARQLKPKDS